MGWLKKARRRGGREHEAGFTCDTTKAVMVLEERRNSVLKLPGKKFSPVTREDSP